MTANSSTVLSTAGPRTGVATRGGGRSGAGAGARGTGFSGRRGAVLRERVGRGAALPPAARAAAVESRHAAGVAPTAAAGKGIGTSPAEFPPQAEPTAARTASDIAGNQRLPDSNAKRPPVEDTERIVRARRGLKCEKFVGDAKDDSGANGAFACHIASGVASRATAPNRPQVQRSARIARGADRYKPLGNCPGLSAIPWA